jgi:O-antigen/teichoic acid export membrane protein
MTALAAPPQPGLAAPPPATRSSAGSGRPALWMVAGNLAFNLLGLATGPILARALGPAGRGTLAAILVPLFLTSWIAALGLPSFARFSAARDGRPRVLAATLAVLSLACGSLAFVAAPAIASALAEGRSVVHAFLLAGLAALPLFIYANVLSMMVIGMERWRITVAAQLLPPVCTLIGLLALWAAGRLTVASAAAVSLGALLLAYLPAGVALKGASGTFRFERPLARRALSFGVRAWPGQLSSLANARLDQLLMIPLVDPADLGLYVVAFTVSTGPAVLGRGFAFALSPRLSKGDTRPVFTGCRLLVPLVLITTGVIAAITPVALPLLFGSDFEPAVPLAWILLGSAIPYQLAVFLGESLTAFGRPGQYATSQIVAFAVTLPGLLVLLPVLGVYGAAIVSVAAYVAQFAYIIGAAHRHFGGRYADLLIPRRDDVRVLVSALPAGLRRSLREVHA